MKKTISGIVFLSLICLSSSLYAGAKEESCEMVLCLYGEKNGNKGGVPCDNAMTQYKKIMKKSKIGSKILCQQTMELRVAKMELCEQDYDLWDIVDCDE